MKEVLDNATSLLFELMCAVRQVRLAYHILLIWWNVVYHFFLLLTWSSENASGQVEISYSFSSDWFRDWCELSDWLRDWCELSDRLRDWCELSDWLRDWCQLSDWLRDWCQLSDWLRDWCELSDRLLDWCELSDWLRDWCELSDRLRDWCELSWPERSKASPEQAWITFDILLKIFLNLLQYACSPYGSLYIS